MYYAPDWYYEPDCEPECSCPECDKHYCTISNVENYLQVLVKKLYSTETINLKDLENHIEDFCDYLGMKYPDTQILPLLNKQTQN